MLGSSIGRILVASGVITAGGGLAALLFPNLFLELGFGVESPTSSAVFFVRHWGVLIFAVGKRRALLFSNEPRTLLCHACQWIPKAESRFGLRRHQKETTCLPVQSGFS
jgi:hypothetical protein